MKEFQLKKSDLISYMVPPSDFVFKKIKESAILQLLEMKEKNLHSDKFIEQRLKQIKTFQNFGNNWAIIFSFFDPERQHTMAKILSVTARHTLWQKYSSAGFKDYEIML